MSPRPAALVGVLVAGWAMGLAACADGGEPEPEPDATAYEGEWQVSLVVGSVDADPGADPTSFPGDATYRERWVFEECDADRCVLRRPDGGLLLGDLDEVDFGFTSVPGIDDEERFVGEGTGEAVPRPEEEGDDHDEGGVQVADDEHCAGSATRRWTVRIEVDERGRVLSGTILRTPEARQEPVDGLTCFGLDVTLGLTGLPAAAGGTTGDG